MGEMKKKRARGRHARSPIYFLAPATQANLIPDLKAMLKSTYCDYFIDIQDISSLTRLLYLLT